MFTVDPDKYEIFGHAFWKDSYKLGKTKILHPANLPQVNSVKCVTDAHRTSGLSWVALQCVFHVFIRSCFPGTQWPSVCFRMSDRGGYEQHVSAAYFQIVSSATVKTWPCCIYHSRQILEEEEFGPARVRFTSSVQESRCIAPYH